MAGSRRRSQRQSRISSYLAQLDLSPEERARLGQLREAEGVQQEIELLRMLIQWSLKGNGREHAEKAAETRKHIETLCKALRLQHLLSGHSEEALTESLVHVLDEMGVQMEGEP